MKTIGLIFLCFSASLGSTQTTATQQVKHAPTFQACSADLNLWSSEIRGFPTSTSEQDEESTRTLTLEEMSNRVSYLNDCAQAYPVFNRNRPGELSALSSLCLVYMQEMQVRLFHFLARHDLTTKFFDEDKAGRR